MTLAAVALILAVAGCAGQDPYYEALEAAGWGDSPLAEAEVHDLYERMAVEICGEMADRLLAGDDVEMVTSALLRKIDSTDPMSDQALGALNALLDYRCDASQPGGLKTS